MKKIIIPYKPVVKSELCGVVRITPEAESILRRMCRETGVPISKIASTIIEQAADSVTFVEID